jgi:hypothetical protein
MPKASWAEKALGGDRGVTTGIVNEERIAKEGGRWVIVSEMVNSTFGS